MGDEGADAGQQEQPGAENAGRGAVCCHLTFQTLLQPLRMAHPYNLLQLSLVGSAIFRMQVAEDCAYLVWPLKDIMLKVHVSLTSTHLSNNNKKLKDTIQKTI